MSLPCLLFHIRQHPCTQSPRGEGEGWSTGTGTTWLELTVDEALCNSWFAGGTRLATHNAMLKHIAEILQEAGIKSLIGQQDIRSIGANLRKRAF